MPFKGSLEDRLLIRERMSEYAASMFQQDLNAWLSNFADDCVWRGVGLEYRGLKALAASWPKLWEPLTRMAYFTEVSAIEVVDDRASAHCYSRQIMFQKDGSIRKFVRLYRDELVRCGGTWVFQLRQFEFIGTEELTR